MRKQGKSFGVTGHGKTFGVTTDKADYAPGDDAVFTASKVDRGSTVEFLVAHVNAGNDGIIGTEDDQYTYDLSGTGLTWAVTDGSEDDADGLLNGVVVTSWHVNSDALNEAFVVTAIDLDSGKSSTAFFTDAPPDVGLAAVDLTASGNSGAVSGVVFQAIPTGSGSGVFPAFVQIQGSPSEQGYNTDFRPQQFNENNSAPHNHSILLSDIPIIIGDGTNGTVAGVAYRVFLFDSNESNGAGNEFLSLDSFQIYQAGADNLTNLTPGVGFPGSGDTLIFDLDAGGDKWIALNSSLSSGGGTSDGVVLVPNSLFINDGAHDYVYLYSKFGGQGAAWSAQSGFEEWALGEGDAIGSISGTKYKDADGNLATTGDRTALSGWTIYIDGDNDNVFDAGEVFTTTDANGHYSFDTLLAGTYTIREVVPTGWHQIFPTGEGEYSVTIAGGDSDTGNDFINVQDAPALNIVKNATVTGGTANSTSDVITYSYTLTNTGNVAISGIVLTDDNGTPGNTNDDFSPSFVSGDTDNDSQLDLGETWTYSRTKSVTQAMLDAGTDIVNIVTADDGAGGATADTDDATVDVVQNKALNIEKNAAVTGNTADSTSDVITYSYTLTNTGNTAIGGIVLTDDNGTPGNTNDDFAPSFVGGDTDGDSKLDVGETWTYSRTKSVTQAMLDAGSDIVNIVTADDGAGGATPDTDDATVDVVQNKALNIEKNAAVTGNTADSTSDVITYSYTLTNTGNAAISGIVLTDDNGTPGNTNDDFSPSFVGGDTDGDSKLDVGETWTYSRTKNVTQAMLDAGSDIVNIVTADGAGDVPADTDDATVDVVQGKALNIEKNASVTGNTADATSDVITYSYTLTNTGNAAISGIVLTDDNGTPGNTNDDFSPTFVGGDTDGDSALDVGETWTYSRTKSVTQTMLDAGSDIVNIVTADGAGDVPADTDDATVDVVQGKALNIEKNALVTGNTADATSDVITYSYTLTNTGNAAISGIVLTDDNGTPGNTNDDFAPSFVGGDTDGDSALDVGETWMYSRTKSVTQAMLDAGSDIVNIVTADGAGDVPADTDDATVDVVQGKALNIEKNAAVTGNTADATSEVITYSYTLTNTGNAAISGIVLTDDNGTPGDTSDDFSPSFVGGDTDGDSALDVGETWTYSRTKGVTQAMLDAGSDIVNIVTADGAGDVPADTDDATVDVVQGKALNIEKNAAVTGNTADATSDVITYSYTLTNTGNAAISGIVLTDDNGTPGDTSDDFSPSFVGGDTDGDSALDVGETWTYSRTKSVTQAMLDAGSDIVNIVTADGAGDVPADTDDATVDVVQSKALNIEKNASVTGDTANSTADVITYSYTLTNTGNAAISGIVLTDDNGTPGDTSDDFSPSFVGGDTDGDSALDVGETWTYSRTKSVTQAMLDAGSDIVNIVTADGTGDVPADTDDATVDVVQGKALNIEKNATVTGNTADSTSDVITYSYTLTNTGNAAISGIVLTDDNGTPGDTSDDFSPSFVGGDTDGDSALDVGETWTYSRTKSVTQAMLDAGTDIVNIVTADGAGDVPADTDDATVDVVQGASLNIEKNAAVTGNTADATSDVITYSYTLTNTGNTAISGIVLTDDNGTPGDTNDDFSPSFVGGDTDGDSALDVGETWTYSRTKSVTQAMLDSGSDIVNIVTADGAGDVPADTDDATVDVVQSKALNIEKNATVTGDTADATSDVITYSYTLTNTGNAAISGIVLTDDNGTPGDTNDDFSPSFVGGDTDGDSALDVGETWTYSRTKSVTQAMLDSGNDVVNIVTADGAGDVPADTDDATVDVVQSKTLNVEKNATVTGNTADATSDVITYSYTLTNTGNAAISGIVLTDDNGTPGDTNDDFSPSFVGGDTDGDSALDVGETWTYSRTKSVTQAMLDAGSDIVNIVTADGAGDVPADTDDATVDVVQSKALNIEKNASVTGDTANSTADVITYSYTLTNTGNAAISGIVLTDDNGTPGDTSDDFSPSFVGGDTDGDSALDVGETWTYSRTKAVTQAMLDAGSDIINIVTADGAGDVPADTDDATVDIVQGKSLNIEKNATVTGDTANSTSDVITYSYTLTNTGNTAISGIVLTDDNGTPGDTTDDFLPTFIGGDTDGDSALDVGETWTYSRTKSVTQAMLDAGNDIVNIVTADDGPDGAPADTDDATVDVVPSKSLTVEKNASVTGDKADSTSDVITYSYTLTNTGNAAISGIVLTDDNGTPGDTSDDFSPSFVGGDTDGDSALDVGETWTYSRTKSVTQAMLDAGSDIVNIVTADGPDTAPATDDATVDVVQSKALTVEKNASVTGDTANAATDVITYSYTLTNTGNAAISGIVLTDDNGTPGDTSDDFSPTFVGGDTDGDSALDVGETWTYSRTKAVTQAMLDAGSDIVNIVTSDSPDTDPATDDATVDVVQSKALNVDKNANVTGGTADSTSDVITYSYTLTNTGNAAISGIVLTDDNGTPGNTNDDFSPTFIGGDTDGDSALDVGETWTYSRTKSVTQEMLDSGDDIINIVTADGPEDTPSDTDDATVDVVQRKSLNIEKNASVNGGTADVTTDVITYSYTLTNTGNTAISGIVLTDDNGTPGDTSDDFSPSFVGGDTDGDSELDVGETWTYSHTRSVTQEMLNTGDDITNIVTADDGEGGAPADTDDAFIDVVKPAGELDITKVVVNIVSKGQHADKVGDVITYKIVVDNTGDTPLTGVVVTDTVEGHAPIVLSAKTGDINNDGILGVNETWTYTYNYTLTAEDLFNLADDNRLDNTATVVTNQTVPESASAAVDLGPSVKTYLDWSLSSRQKFWDGIAGNEIHSQTVTDGFPMSDITRPPYANPDTDAGGPDQAGMVLDPVTGTYKLGILVGDWNLNGETDAGEQTLFYTPAEALAILTASSTIVNADARYLLARELLGAWLNYQAGNPVVDLNEGLLGDALDAQDMINWAIAWLQSRTGNEGGTAAGDGSLTFQAATWKILTSSPYWTTGIDGGDAYGVVDGVSPVPFFDDPANDGDVPAGATIRSYLGEYNNDGTILGVHIALE